MQLRIMALVLNKVRILVSSNIHLSRVILSKFCGGGHESLPTDETKK